MHITVLPQAAIPRTSEWLTGVHDVLGRHLLVRLGRDALTLGIEWLGLRPGATVLMPSSLCAVAIAPFLRAGLKVRLYRVDDQLNLDFDDISRKLDRSVCALYLNHYLGRPSQADRARKLCDEAKIKLIEDCAHTLLGRVGGREVGTFGDIAIYSLRKFLSIPDGGALRFNAKGGEPTPPRRHAIGATFRDQSRWALVGLAARNLLPSPIGFRRRDWIDRYLAFEDVIALDADIVPRTISPLSRELVARSDLSEIARARRENFDRWRILLTALPQLRPLFPGFDGGECPYGFPILVKERRELITHLAAHGILAEPTILPPYYSAVATAAWKERFVGIEALAQDMVTLPVHQGLTTAVVDRIGTMVMDFFAIR